MNDLKKIDYTEQAHSRLAEQFKDSERLKAFIKAITEQLKEVQDAYFDLLDKRHLDVAEGAQLDVIGRIVGQDRILLNADIFRFFTITDANAPVDDPELGFGDENEPEIGGIFRSEGQPTSGNIKLDDKTYRQFIRAKIIKNFTNSSPEKLIEFIRFVFGDVKVFLFELPAHTIIMIGRKLNRNERAIFSAKDRRGRHFVPKTIGTGLGIGDFDPDNFFAFQGVPGAKGFNEGEFASFIQSVE